MKALFKLSLLLCILISSCKKEINEVTPNQSVLASKPPFNFSEIESVKNWFQTTVLSTASLRISGNETPTKQVKWNEYFYHLLDGKKILLVPIRYRDCLNFCFFIDFT
ncbi:hypothetical protein [Runella rosea]|uniref:hypothetical protein n=1 Tax=Runella rosea TaxID=2259595 RepID=UPI0013B39A1E|nr:hypothetical protein [Runella rosea]